MTLARLRSPRDVRPLLAEAPPLVCDVGIPAITLYQSELSAQGARYTPIARAPFAVA